MPDSFQLKIYYYYDNCIVSLNLLISTAPINDDIQVLTQNNFLDS